MSDELRRCTFAHLDLLQTELVNIYDGWRNVPNVIRGHVESLRQIAEVGIQQSPTTPGEAADRVEGLVRQLPSDKRAKARMVIKRRMMHPETGHVGTLCTEDSVVHPRSNGRNYANSVSGAALCLVCNRSAAQHDIDGLNDQCDGYVVAP
ncbi:hypothetical protein [Mycobacterium sp. PSTR-4-N]|uniref:hypothetical protein n=1 Tax=Mycobacterium sp. PSTR-4-N TaxID=2917745 RepID=UPI001F1510CD|nr:hypothetical protein [Mycobacterium sp. PSTR-4-N]MCG7596306.1 hypothetical protein [Mycobacterium sp. PSTR-4-N]